MKIGGRLAGCFAIIILIMLGVCIFTVNSLSYINDRVDVITVEKWQSAVMLQEVSHGTDAIALAIRNALLVNDPAVAKEKLAIIPEISRRAVEDYSKLDRIITNPEGKALLKEIDDSRTPYKAVQKEVVAAIEAGDRQKATELVVGRYGELQRGYMAAIQKAIDFQGKNLVAAGDNVREATKSTEELGIIFSVIAILLGSVFGYLVTKSITKPVAELVEINSRLAEGDLTVEVTLQSKDEIGLLANSSRKVIASMRDILSNVAHTSGLVAAASHQLQVTAEEIAAGAEELAIQTTAVATASEEMAATSSDIAANCITAADRSKASSASATKGGAVVEETIAGMSRIATQVKQSAQTVEELGARSVQIGEIVGTIEDIADQTNLLALNAAIEAARAGEQGRGFAVVADEVRALAERTTRATKEISEMIRNIQKETQSAVMAMEEGVSEVEKGAATSQRSGEALHEILAQIDEVTLQINQIATAAEEQTATTSEITGNVHQVTEVVQQTSRGASETASASAQLAADAKLLQSLVQRFKLVA
jgi:methyl-accepting chemotaxis protein